MIVGTLSGRDGEGWGLATVASMRIASWNVNSIRVRMPMVVSWAGRFEPDVIALQETRCTDGEFPAGELEDLGYEVVHHGDGPRNGVALASRVGLEAVERGFRGPQRGAYAEARLIGAICGGVRIHSVYVPNGRALDDPHYLFKLVWLERLRGHLQLMEGDVPQVAVGDFNVAPADIDIYDPVRWRRRTHASPPEREAIAALVDLGLCDVFRDRDPSPGLYTWWNYRSPLEENRGMRIDLALVDHRVASRVSSTGVDRAERASERPSDHAPIWVDID